MPWYFVQKAQLYVIVRIELRTAVRNNYKGNSIFRGNGNCGVNFEEKYFHDSFVES